MTIYEAIVTIEAKFTDPGAVPTSDFRRACRLGIEAMKRVRNIRNTIMLSSNGLLLGETED